MKHDPQQADFTRLLSEFSRGCNVSDIEQMDACINSALGKISDLVCFNFATLVSFSEHNETGQLVGVWHSLEHANAPEMSEHEPPWVIGEVQKGKSLAIPNLSISDKKSAQDHAYFTQLGIATLYALPLFDHSGVAGGLILGSTEPEQTITEDVIDRLQILGQILISTTLKAEREIRLSDTIEAAEIGSWSLDFSSMTFWATESARAMHGFNPTEMIDLGRVLGAVHPDDRELVRKTILQAQESPQDVRVEYRIVQADNSLHWLVARGRSYNNASGAPQQLMGVCTDITERKRADEELRNARALTDAVFDSVPGLLYLYSADGKLRRWNKQHELMTGYSAEELLDFPAANWFTEADLEIMQRAWARTFSEGRATVELGLKLKNGTIAPFVLTGVSVEIDGKPHLVGIGMDITEKRRIETSLAQLRNELAHATRVTTLGELVSTLAHELNQPLAAILSNAQATRRLLAMPEPDLEEVRAAVEDIVRDDKRAGEIVHGLRGLVAREDVKSTRLDMNTLVRGVADLLNGEFVSADVPLVLQLDPDLPMVEAGQTEIQQVLLNLMLNGITAQRVTDPATRRLTVSTSHDTNSVIITVCDRGIGIPADVLPQLFQPFFTTRPSGLGMGLAICKRITESYHGKIWAENNQDGGASFFLKLQRAESN